MFTKNLSARLVIMFILMVGVLGIMPQHVSAQAESGSISGTVYAADGVTTLPNILIVYESQDNLISQATCADEDGSYTFHNVPLDVAVRVKARSNLDTWCNTGEDYLLEYWPGTPNVESADFLDSYRILA